MAEPSSAPTSTAITLPPIEPDSFPVLPASRGPASAILDFANNAIESAALRDGIKLIIVGGALEAARRAFSLIGQQIVERESVILHQIRLPAYSPTIFLSHRVHYTSSLR
jgi:hypothetical protein